MLLKYAQMCKNYYDSFSFMSLAPDGNLAIESLNRLIDQDALIYFSDLKIIPCCEPTEIAVKQIYLSNSTGKFIYSV